jgi:hypothetical protein
MFRRLFGTQAAKNIQNNASTATLKSALTNYIKEVNKLQTKNGAAIRNAMKGNTPNGTYETRILNGIAKVVAASPRVLAKANQSTQPAAPVTETQAATAVNNTANKLANLNKYMNTLSGYTNNKNRVNQYKATGRNLNANIALNAGRNGGPKYANFFKLVSAPKYNKNTSTQTLLNANVAALSVNNRANLLKAINSKLNSANTTNENKQKT